MTNELYEPLAIIGMACRWPGGAHNSSAFWDLLINKRSAQSKVPSDRFSIESYYHPNLNRPDSIPADGGYFISEDFRAFDPSFFGIGSKEAAEIDPQQRKLLEVSYECFESAGVSLESLSGSLTGCFVGSFSADYSDMTVEEPENYSSYHATGSGVTIISNRINYVFDLKGPSMTINTACSSSLYALHLASNSLHAGDCDSALVGGTTLHLRACFTASLRTRMQLVAIHEAMRKLRPDLILNTPHHISSGKLGILSPTSTCHTFSADADGYGRADGVGVLLVKKLSKAVADGDHIRAIIRASSFNANGKTGGLTTPSVDGQETVIRETYRKAKLDPVHTGYFECHGTGTPVGDPIEAEAIARVFAESRSPTNKLLIGSVKTNIGHGEAASGIAGLMKVVLALENGIIPPTVGFQTPNPRIDFVGNHLQVVTEPTSWPETCARRASINSFGYGGANAHVIIEKFEANTSKHGTKSCSHFRPYLLPVSAKSNISLQKLVESYLPLDPKLSLLDLAYTLSVGRSMFQHRAFIVARETKDSLLAPVVRTGRPTKRKNLGFVFTGQGAQYPGMGKELMLNFPLFAEVIVSLDEVIANLEERPAWTIKDTLLEPSETSKIHSPDRSQTICTALQIGLVSLLRSWNIHAVATIGHSSGEIAAAYAAGYLTAEAAIVIAHFRGRAIIQNSHDGAMMAVAQSEDSVASYLHSTDICVACVNSPCSVTLSGSSTDLVKLANTFTEQGVFFRILSTGGNAYHSTYMKKAGKDYEISLQNVLKNFNTVSLTNGQAVMVSTVTGEPVSFDMPSLPSYWRRNLESQVLFDKALGYLLQHNTEIDILVEIGPHSTLKGPITDVMRSNASESDITYATALVRGSNGAEQILTLAGELFLKGHAINLKAVNMTDPVEDLNIIPNLPRYPWNYEKLIWKEPRISLAKRFRKHPRHDILGTLEVGACDKGHLVWRNTFRLGQLPWLEQHVIEGLLYFPAAALVAMAIEALLQLVELQPDEVDGKPEAIHLQDLAFKEIFRIPKDGTSIEIVFTLKKNKKSTRKCFELTCSSSPDIWVENFSASGHLSSKDKSSFSTEEFGSFSDNLRKRGGSQLWYDRFIQQGIEVGPAWQTLFDIRTCPGEYEASAKVPLGAGNASMPHQSRYCIHPIAIDASFQLTTIAIRAGDIQAMQGRLIPKAIEKLSINLVNDKWTDCFTINNSIGDFQAIGAVKGAKYFGSSQLCVGEAKGKKALMNIHNVSFAVFNDPLFQQSVASQQPYMRMIWKPYIDLLSNEQLRAIFPSGATDQVDSHSNHSSSMEELSSLIEQFAACALLDSVRHISATDPVGLGRESYLKLYCNWLLKEAEDLQCSNDILGANLARFNEQDLRNEYHRLATNATQTSEGKYISLIHDNMLDILEGKLNSHELILENNLLSQFYTHGIRAKALNAQLGALLDLLAHQNPNMDILELGAGTGSTTITALDTLRGKSITKRYRRYVFTDIGSSFVSTAQEKLKGNSGMEFRTYDLTQSPNEQAELRKYDLVIAANAVHVSKDIVRTLADILTLLKPGGRLILLENTKDTLISTYLFGVFNDWWIKRGDAVAPGAAIIKREAWEGYLQQAGFPGLEFVLDDIPGKLNRTNVLVARNTSSETFEERKATVVSNGIVHVDEPALEKNRKTVYIVYRTGTTASNPHQTLSSTFLQAGYCPYLLPLSSVQEIPISSYIVSLLDWGTPLFTSLDHGEWPFLQHLISVASTLLWITTGSLLRSPCPDYGIAQGWARSLRLENPTLKIWTLDLEDERLNPSQCIIRVFNGVFDGSINAEEHDFIHSDGVFHVSRLEEDVNLNQRYLERWVTPSKNDSTTNLTDRSGVKKSLQFRFDQLGMLDSGYYVESALSTAIGEDWVEIEVGAWSLGSKGVLAMMAKFPEESYTIEGSGTVIKVGRIATRFTPGDRVLFLSPGKFDTVLRVKQDLCHTVDERFSFEELATIPSLFPTAIHSLLHQAHLSPGETILIHSAAGGLGLAALQIAKSVGAVIYATVGTSEKVEFLQKSFGIPASHIFSSRGDFKQALLHATDEKGVDVVFNTLNGELFQDSLDCVAYFGCFLELGFKDVYDGTMLDLRFFERNATFYASNLSDIYDRKPKYIGRLLQETVLLLRSGTITPIKPMIVFDIAELKEAVRCFMNSSHIGKVVISFANPRSEVKVRRSPNNARFPQHSTYLIVGGFGGLGQSTINWMVSQGVRNFLVLSRSGPNSTNTRRWVESLSRNGVMISFVKGDVTVLEDVQHAAEEAKKQPPIRGIIHSAMHIVDALFEDMRFEQFKAVLQSKTLGVQNLYTAFRDSQLDFFLMASSIESLIGTATQSGYCAANSFLDFHSRYLLARGCPAVSINLGKVAEVGYVAENPAADSVLTRLGIQHMYEYEFHHCLEVAIFQNRPASKFDPLLSANVITGLDPMRLRELWGKGLGKETQWKNDFRFMAIVAAAEANQTNELAIDNHVTTEIDVTELRNCPYSKALSYTTEKIAARIAMLLLLDSDAIDSTRPPIDYGIDSMVGAELRHWLLNELRTTVPFADLLNPRVSIDSLAERCLVNLRGDIVPQMDLQDTGDINT